MVKLADAPDLGSGAARRSGSSPLGGTTSGHGARCKGMSKAHPFRFYAGPSSFPKNLRCANLFWEPYSFTYKANLVSPWAFAQGLYSIACSLAQSILRSVTELPAQWAIPKFGRMPKPHRGYRQNIRPHPFSPKSFAAQNICGSPVLCCFSATGALLSSHFRSTDTPTSAALVRRLRRRAVGLRTSSSRGGTTSGHGARCKGMSTAHPFRFYAGPLAQSILRPVTELPAHWAIRFRL